MPDVPKRNARRPLAVRPYVRAGGPPAEGERLVDDAHLRVDLERTSLYPDRARLLRGAGVTVDDHWSYAAAHELIGQHESRWPGADDQDVDVHEISL